jgi:hypothetical protein
MALSSGLFRFSRGRLRAPAGSSALSRPLERAVAPRWGAFRGPFPSFCLVVASGSSRPGRGAQRPSEGPLQGSFGSGEGRGAWRGALRQKRSWRFAPTWQRVAMQGRLGGAVMARLALVKTACFQANRRLFFGLARALR